MKEYPGKLISIIHRKSQIHWNRELKQYGISAAEISIFIHLFKHEGITQDELSAALSLDKSAVARIIQSLMEKGFLKKKKDDADHRCNRIFLTSKGKELKTPILSSRERLNRKLLHRMNEEEQEEFLRLLHIAADSIQTSADIMQTKEEFKNE